MGHWARIRIDPDQPELIAVPLRQQLAEDHPVHLFDEVMGRYDWSAWEKEFVLVEGQPPIHPRFIAGPLVYGLTVGVRSTRGLEGACLTRLDFQLLSRGHQPDHSTFGLFRTRFQGALEDLMRFICRMAVGMGLARLNRVGLDGTRVRANSSRRRTVTAATLEERLAAVDKEIAELFARAEQEDLEEDTLFGKEVSPHRLDRELADVVRRQEALERALANARLQGSKKPAKKRASSGAKGKGASGDEGAKCPASGSGDCAPNLAENGVPEPPPALAAGEGAAPAGESPSGEAGSASPKPKAPKVPVADPDSTIQPNKDGGFAPNYTPMAAVDTLGGFILDADVLPNSDEGQATVPTLDRIRDAHGQMPEEFLGDSKHGTGPNLEALAQRGVTAFIPLEQRNDTPDNPARRPDPTAPVAEADWPRLPRNPATGKLDRAAFVYDGGADCYWCPQGRRLPFWREQKNKGTILTRAYRCETCAGCPLAGRCLAGRAPQRTVSRDTYEPLREAMDARLRTPEGRAKYERRRWACETPFAFIKTVMGVRQFLLRGIEKVRTEWRWVCTAYNLRKLVSGMARQRGCAGAQA
mgnify:CR=1 FL=1